MAKVPAQAPATAPSSSTAKQPASLPDHWIERLFQKFEDYYGAKWAAQYGSFPRERVKRTWAEELAGFAEIPDAIARALEAQKQSAFPPTMPEFLNLCREAARSLGPKPKPLALDHKLTPEEMERNRERVSSLLAGLGRKMTSEPQAQAGEAGE